MTGNIPSSSKGKKDEKTLIEDVEGYIYELPYSYFAKSSTRLFYKIDNGKVSVLPLSKSADFIETLGEVFHSEYMVSHLLELDPKPQYSLILKY